jgi:hypothetical protein
MVTFNIPSVYEALDSVMKYYPDNFNEKAKAEIDILFSHCLEGLSNDSEKFLSTLFIKSLLNHVGSKVNNEHIYLKKYELPQIQLFNILIKEFPFVQISQQITNNIIIDLIKDEKEATIIDIGIGQGMQIKNLIESAKDKVNLKKLTIIGIEPFKDALDKAEDLIESYNQQIPFEVYFFGINDFIENIDFTKLTVGSGKVIINASLALHHIQTLHQRYKVIADLKCLNPAAFLLIEPNIDHFEPNFYRRFRNCYRHFYTIFKVIDKLKIDNGDKNGLKLFFGREIEDIIGKKESERFERHEPAYMWIDKLSNGKFKTNKITYNSRQHPVTDISIRYHDEGYLGFTIDNETILSVIHAS